jgi:hypothetical protein
MSRYTENWKAADTIAMTTRATFSEGVPIQGSRPQQAATRRVARSVGSPIVPSQSPRRANIHMGAPKSASTKAVAIANKLTSQVHSAIRIRRRPKRKIRNRVTSEFKGCERVSRGFWHTSVHMKRSTNDRR